MQNGPPELRLHSAPPQCTGHQAPLRLARGASSLSPGRGTPLSRQLLSSLSTCVGPLPSPRGQSKPGQATAHT